MYTYIYIYIYIYVYIILYMTVCYIIYNYIYNVPSALFPERFPAIEATPGYTSKYIKSSLV